MLKFSKVKFIRICIKHLTSVLGPNAILIFWGDKNAKNMNAASLIGINTNLHIPNHLENSNNEQQCHPIICQFLKVNLYIPYHVSSS